MFATPPHESAKLNLGSQLGSQINSAGDKAVSVIVIVIVLITSELSISMLDILQQYTKVLHDFFNISQSSSILSHCESFGFLLSKKYFNSIKL